MSHPPRHRGPHLKDEELFSDEQVGSLRLALRDLCWLLSRGYAIPSSLKIVGDRYQLVERQRLLLMRLACTDTQRAGRQSTRRSAETLVGRDLYLDGFNVLIAIESALSRSFLFVGQDGCYRDLASVHGTYKRVQETQDALRVIGETLVALQVRKTTWLLDKPVSNSGRLQTILNETAQQHDWHWQVELCQSPDADLKRVSGTVVTTDSAILDAVADWFHLNQEVVERMVPDARVVDLRTSPD
jgi:hypothetical protein